MQIRVQVVDIPAAQRELGQCGEEFLFLQITSAGKHFGELIRQSSLHRQPAPGGLLAVGLTAQQLPAKWEELTAADFLKALQASRGTCALPFGILEKHGPAGVLGTDLLNVRFSTIKAARDEYTIVFPEYYVGQIFEAKHQPGTIAYNKKDYA